MELVARLARVRRLKPRRPKDHEWAGLASVVWGVFLCGISWKVVSSGRYIKGLLGTGAPVGRDTWLEWVPIGIAALLSIGVVVLGVVLAWDWLRDPWEHE